MLTFVQANVSFRCDKISLVIFASVFKLQTFPFRLVVSIKSKCKVESRKTLNCKIPYQEVLLILFKIKFEAIVSKTVNIFTDMECANTDKVF